jgi:hypothetical protein
MSSAARRFRRNFDKLNPMWDNVDRRKNPVFVSFVQECMNDLLQTRGYVSLNDVLRFLGFPSDIVGDSVGWLRDPKPGEGDGRIYFGVWDRGFAHGKDWIQGNVDVLPISFNVDKADEPLPVRVRRLKEKGKL